MVDRPHIHLPCNFKFLKTSSAYGTVNVSLAPPLRIIRPSCFKAHRAALRKGGFFSSPGDQSLYTSAPAPLGVAARIEAVSAALSPVMTTVLRRGLPLSFFCISASLLVLRPRATTLQPIVRAISTARPPKLPPDGPTMTVSPALRSAASSNDPADTQ
ncbi:uncharacterized protein FMAN_02022 [Fusarium mangiferae]|uniref:Uncharacterized protein n=1 Tax=Fusarium mangiferae TaxID=192010 RepID=A0A1L7SF13_FUSMA|nr:uncharacterized protein FMAN_02022 [Fusarium mangiferae]CVK85109.1 uncharacterized protein FMAN_02022 [Fusarium mangiferae]